MVVGGVELGNREGKKPININILGGTVFGTNRNLPWDKRDSRSRDEPGPVPFHSKIAILSRLSQGWVLVVPGATIPQGPLE